MYRTVIKMDLQQSERFDLAAEVLSAPLRRMVLGLPKGKKERIQEIRLRENRPLILIEQGVPLFLDERGGATYICRGNSRCVSPAELTDTFNKICGYSVHSHMDSIINGYITIPGGHRAGICGTAVTQGGKIVNVRDVHAVNIRVAGEYRNAAEDLVNRVFRTGLTGILVAGPPSSGKTTILRDLARRLSSGEAGRYYKIAVVDERDEIAGTRSGTVLNDVGVNCDVFSAYPKGEGIMTALRAFSPDMIICDEIGGEADIRAVECGVNSGVRFAASVHASSREELFARSQFSRLAATGAFEKVVLLADGNHPCTIREVIDLKGDRLEDTRDDSGDGVLHGGGPVLQRIPYPADQGA
ncbi:MAG TPA: Flp pilus assembly complex ATPase component TadA [Candidatus Onthovicinus excrementipullorum]|nr:Flp pilus assembly complex ATPase component TadA [Candidatus Onthovicinus excrementipullorum]